jgi:hypothetical protein
MEAVRLLGGDCAPRHTDRYAGPTGGNGRPNYTGRLRFDPRIRLASGVAGSLIDGNENARTVNSPTYTCGRRAPAGQAPGVRRARNARNWQVAGNLWQRDCVNEGCLTFFASASSVQCSMAKVDRKVDKKEVNLLSQEQVYDPSRLAAFSAHLRQIFRNN